MYRRFLTFITCSFLCLSLSGCFGALIGAAAGGTGAYFAKKEVDRSSTKESVAIAKKVRREEREKYQQEINSNITNDMRVESAITKKMLSGGLTKVLSLHSVVKNGVVNLYGNVPSQGVADRAIDIARRQPGVKKVINNLVIVEVKISSPKSLKPSKTIKGTVPAKKYSPANPNLRGSSSIQGISPNVTTTSRHAGPTPLSKQSYVSQRDNRTSSIPQIKAKMITPPTTLNGAPVGSTLAPRSTINNPIE